jgi:serine/threonine protein kinase
MHEVSLVFALKIIQGAMYNYSVDYWSFGVLLYELVSGFSPFHGDDEDDLFNAITTADVFYPTHMTENVVSILKLFFQRDPPKRLGMPTCPNGSIQSQPFFSCIDWNKIENKQIEPPYKPKIVRSSQQVIFGLARV